MARIEVTATTDGACIGNPGPGGYAGIYVVNGVEHTVKGGAIATTNNQMELYAVIAVMKAISVPAHITFRVDSQYVMMDREKWARWQMKKTGIKNLPLWQKLIEVGKEKGHFIEFVHIDGHSGDPLNERVDKLAKTEARKASLLRRSDT